jgi:hypothetical protein
VSFPIVLSNGPPPEGFQAIADAGVTMIRAGRTMPRVYRFRR